MSKPLQDKQPASGFAFLKAPIEAKLQAAANNPRNKAGLCEIEPAHVLTLGDLVEAANEITYWKQRAHQQQPAEWSDVRETLLRAEQALDDLGACPDAPGDCDTALDGICVSALYHVRRLRNILDQKAIMQSVYTHQGAPDQAKGESDRDDTLEAEGRDA